MGELPVSSEGGTSPASVAACRVAAWVLTAALPSVTSAVADGPVVRPDRVVAASDPGPWDVAGYAIAFDGTTLLLGARGVDAPASNSGAVYVFRRVSGQWAQTQKLVFSASTANSQIGTSVAVLGAVGVAGAPNRGMSGAAFVLRASGGAWFSQVELTDAQLGSGAQFGASVACSENVLAVAAPNASEGVGAGAGRVRIFDRVTQTWSAGQVVRAPFPDPGDRFGESVSLSGNWLAVGSPGDDDWEINSGAVYVFERVGGTFVQRAKLRAPVPQAEAWYGSSVAVRDGMLVVGAPFENRLGFDDGSAYVYRIDASGIPVLARVLSAAVPTDSLNFGYSVATDGVGIVVGAPGFAVEDAVVGGAWAYLDADGVADAVLRPSGTPTLSLAGTGVAISSGAVVVGCPAMQVGFSVSAGGALLLDRTRDCNSNGIPDAIDIAAGAEEDLDLDGTPDDCECRADIFVDGFVDGADLGVLLAQWGPSSVVRPSDFNRDGIVNGDDLGYLLSRWGACPPQP